MEKLLRIPISESGLSLAMHYCPNFDLAFSRVVHTC
jgi:hypothetical protein